MYRKLEIVPRLWDTWRISWCWLLFDRTLNKGLLAGLGYPSSLLPSLLDLCQLAYQIHWKPWKEDTFRGGMVYKKSAGYTRDTSKITIYLPNISSDTGVRRMSPVNSQVVLLASIPEVPSNTWFQNINPRLFSFELDYLTCTTALLPDTSRTWPALGYSGWHL